jgi:hypothetical protein
MTRRTPKATRWLFICAAGLFAFATPSRGAIVSVPVFRGTASENFDNLVVAEATQEATILGGRATVTNLTPGGALKFELSSSLDGDLVVPHSPPRMMGQIGISQWVFTTPLLQFGSYFENNSRFDNATVDFYDVNDQLIGSVVATDPRSLQAWTWNGWQSDVPIHRLVITGNDTAFFNGFIWFDDVQTIAVPEPSSIALLVMSGLGVLLKRFGMVKPARVKS